MSSIPEGMPFGLSFLSVFSMCLCAFFCDGEAGRRNCYNFIQI